MELKSSMWGTISSLPKEGDTLETGEPLYGIEIMKNIYTIQAPYKLMVLEVIYKVGDEVQVGDTILHVDREVEPEW